MPDLAGLLAAVRPLLPEGTAVAASDPQASHPVWPAEEIRAVPARLREFAAGRAAARAAMRALGQAPAAIPMQVDRAPLWPPGVAGSISHSATACLAMVARAPRLIGLDIEPDTPLPPGLLDTILRPDEQGCPDPLLVFVAKEAAYKAQYPFSRRVFGFQTLRIRLTAQAFTATFCEPVGPFAAGFQVGGHHVRAAGQVVAWISEPLPTRDPLFNGT